MRVVTTSRASSAGHDRSVSPAERGLLGQGADPAAWPRAFGMPPVTGMLRRHPEDFTVDERLPFALSGVGEHLYLRIRKTGQNTRWVARQLARQLDLPVKAVGFAGLKDRHAVTSQWFSVHLPGRPDPDPASWSIQGTEVIEAIRHSAKLRTGALSGNRFRLLIRDLVGDIEALGARCNRLRSAVVPNFFGAQRFGHDGANLDLLPGTTGRPDRHARSFGLSALRAAMFNGWLAGRIESGTWREPLSGEILQRPADGRFLHESKLAPGEGAYPTGLLWGVGDNQATGEALTDEQAFFDAFPGARRILAEFDARMMRRPLCTPVEEFRFSIRGDTLELQFSLPRGRFATTAIRELGDFFDSA